MQFRNKSSVMMTDS